MFLLIVGPLGRKTWPDSTIQWAMMYTEMENNWTVTCHLEWLKITAYIIHQVPRYQKLRDYAQQFWRSNVHVNLSMNASHIQELSSHFENLSEYICWTDELIIGSGIDCRAQSLPHSDDFSTEIKIKFQRNFNKSIHVFLKEMDFSTSLPISA